MASPFEKQKPPAPQTVPVRPAAPGTQDPEWDVVSQASWESFPASDPPGWIHSSKVDRRKPLES